MWFIYIARCADHTLYTGITDNLDKRLAAHNAGKGAKYTRGRTPIEFIYSEGCEDRSAASKREAELKKLSKTQKLRLINTRQS